MWDYVPTEFLFCRWRGRIACAGSKRKAWITWTRVHAIIDYTTCRKYWVSGRDLRAYLTTRGRLGIVRSSSSLIRHRSWSWSSSRCMDGCDASRQWWTPIGRWTLFTIKAYVIARSWSSIYLKLNRAAWRIRRRTPWSRSDRTAIVALPSWNQGHDARHMIPRNVTSFLKRNFSDRGFFLKRNWKRSWPDHCAFRSKIEADLSRNWSHEAAQEIRPHDAIKPRPRPLQLPTIFRLIFPLITHVFSLCYSTFDRFMKELRKFRGRSLVHHDPPAFTLDCKAIGAGLITNFSLISSNFPLEFRTSTRKNLSKFASIHENWSPILVEIALVVRFDRLSRGNLSFY